VSASRIVPASAQTTDEGADEASFLRRAEVRDVLAWMRLLVDPHDAAAVVRALARPPIELRQVHLARVIQVARRRKLDLVSGVAAAAESPQVPPEARERIGRFVELHRRAAAGLDTLGPEVFIVSLIDILRARGRPLLAPQGAAEQDASLERLRELAAAFARRSPGSTPRELAAHLASVSPQARWSGPGAARQPWHAPERPAGELEAALQGMREEVLESVSRIAGRLSELRLDTELDIAHGVVRYLELLKLAALLQRPAGQDVGEALADINARLLAAATPLQREILQSSSLDESVLAGRSRLAQQEEHSLGPFLPRRGTGLALSASDIETYRACPLRYKYSRVLRIPTGQTLHQRFGIVVHQVLERFHSEPDATLERMLELFEACWARAGLGQGPEHRALREKARTSLIRYHERLQGQGAEPVWFERTFAFRLGPHHLRGRVDRVDRLADGAGEPEYELIDYKTSRPKSADDLRDDIQLSLYALAAREDWQLPRTRQAYYYVLDDRKVPVPAAQDPDSLAQTVLEVGEGILAERFDPTPSPATCALCDYRIVCPVAQA